MPMKVSQLPSKHSRPALLAYVKTGSATPSSNLLCASSTKGALYMASASWSKLASKRYLARQKATVVTDKNANCQLVAYSTAKKRTAQLLPG